MRRIAPLFLCVGMLTACGQKGPLYLPSHAPASPTAAINSPPISHAAASPVAAGSVDNAIVAPVSASAQHAADETSATLSASATKSTQVPKKPSSTVTP